MAIEENENNSWRNFYLKGMISSIVYCFIAIFIMISAWFGWANYFDDKPHFWFQRSGSVGVGFLFLADYWIYKLSVDVSKKNMIPRFAMKTKDQYRPYIPFLQFTAISLTVLATFIWGYGDIVYCEIKGGC